MFTEILTRSSYILFSAYFILAIAFSFVINMLFLRFFKTLGIRNNNDGNLIRWSTSAKPSIGGITFYIVFLLSLASYSILFEPSIQMYHLGFVGLIISCAAGFLIGLADDAYDTRPYLKFGVQLLCGIVLVVTGVQIHIFESDVLNIAITLFWVVGIMNSVNMLDNMDGITAIVSIGIIVNTIYRIVFHGDLGNMHLIALLGVLASLVAFLRFNWHPSKIYMGDTGSQFIGVFLATMGIIYFWNDPYAVSAPATGKLFASTIITFILPIVDTTVVVINRMSQGKSPFIGGKDHTTHSLAYLGFNDNQVALIFLALAVISLAGNIIMMEFLKEWSHAYSILFGVWLTLLLSFFFYSTRKNLRHQKAVKAEK